MNSFFRLIGWIFLVSPIVSNADDINILVVAIHGIETAKEEWQPTLNHLQSSIPQHSFNLMPFKPNQLSEIKDLIGQNKIDFVITQPAIYVDLEKNFGISRILTMVKKGGYSEFGSTIITLPESGIRSIDDLQGKTIAGVAELGFGGWLLGYKEMLDNGFDPYVDAKDIVFLGTQPKQVEAVLKHEVDAAVIRTGELEKLSTSGIVDIDDFFILNSKSYPNFPLKVSTPLYPEWAFAKTKEVSNELAKVIALAMLSLEKNSPAALTAGYQEWTFPYDYEPVHEILRELRVGPYANYGQVSTLDFIKQHKIESGFFTVLTLIIFILIFIVYRSNRNLRHTLVVLGQRELELRELNESLEGRVKERTHALETSNKELEAYSYSIAHDLRAPLRSIVGFSQLLQEDARENLSDEEVSYLDRVIKAGIKMAQLIDDILALGRISRQEIKRQLLDLSAIADDVIQQLKQEDPERVVAVDIEPGLKSQGDPQLLRQLLYNLLGNAWKFTRLEAQANIEFSQLVVQPEVIYRISDNGAGFDSKHTEHLFKPFQRLHGSNEFEGTGIGLATAYRIVSRHGGRIWAEAKPGDGAEFYFTLSAK